MCVRFVPLRREEAEAVLRAREQGGGGALGEPHFDPVYDAYPGSDVPIYVWDARLGRLVCKLAHWGFDLDGRRDAVFNTRLETALDQLARGRRGLWVNAIARGRCLVPVRAFYEGHDSERVPGGRDGRPVRRQYQFTMPGARAFLLAGVESGGRFSVVTTGAAGPAAAVHDRMPLALGRGESGMWLGEGFASLADRGGLRLEARAER